MEYYGNNDWRDYKALQHYGVKGMMWRKRKVRPSDGPVTVINTASSNSNRNGKPIKRKKKVERGGTGIKRSGSVHNIKRRVGIYFEPAKVRKQATKKRNISKLVNSILSKKRR